MSDDDFTVRLATPIAKAIKLFEEGGRDGHVREAIRREFGLDGWDSALAMEYAGSLYEERRAAGRRVA